MNNLPKRLPDSKSHSWMYSHWGIEPLLGTQSWELDQSLDTPKILLIDDDPMFCAAVKRKAKTLKLDLTVCKTLEDINKLSGKFDYDVAILDYFFGSDLTALQLAALFTSEVPIIIVSNTPEGRKLSGNSWPPEVRSFLHKNVGTDAILAEALLAAHWPQLIPENTEISQIENLKYSFPGWLPIAATVFGVAALTLLYLSIENSVKLPFLKWDRAPIVPSSSYSKNSLIERDLDQRELSRKDLTKNKGS